MRPRLFIASMVLVFAAINGFAQGVITPRRHLLPPTRPQQGTENPLTAAPIATPNSAEANEPIPSTLPVSAIKIKLKIVGQVAIVRVEHQFRNDTSQDLEGTYYFPVPEGASLLEFAVYDGDERRVGRVKEKEEARAAYAAAAAQGEDPAMLEMTRRGWFQSHIYPIPAHSDKRVEMVYSQVLAAKDQLITFAYALGQGYKKLRVPVGKVAIELDLSATAAIKNVFSPSHPMDFHFDGERHVSGKLETVGGGAAENFTLQYSLAETDVSLSLLTYRQKGEDGYFLMLLSPKIDFDRRRISAKDCLFVIDISGSMAGDKLQQAKAALQFGLQQTLKESDRFNIVAFDDRIIPMSSTMLMASPASLAKALDFIDQLKAVGGTNINDALIAAMQMFEDNGRPHNLVFLTDGEPSASITDPNTIAANVRAANHQRVKLFSFGIGAGVNHYLLEKLSTENRGATANINDAAELKRTVSAFFARVAQPVLADLQVDFGALQVERMQPSELPDLYTRGQIKIFGRYRNAEALRDATVILTGRMNEEAQRFDFSGLNFPLETTDNEFLATLWAHERIAALLAQIRLYGETPERKDEVIQLAKEFNLVTPYTSMYVPTTAELQRERLIEPAAPQTNPSATPPNPPGDITTSRVDNLPLNGRSFVADVRSQANAANAPANPASNTPFEALRLLTGRTPQNQNAASVDSRGGLNNPSAPAPPGTVVDANGAVIANATITIKDQNTGATRMAQTDANGNYSVAGLPPGEYSIAVAAPGFTTTQLQNVTVQPGQVTATGVEMSVATVTEVVLVTSVASALNASTAQLATTIEPKKVKDLPLLEPLERFALLAPGVKTSSEGLNRPQTGFTHEFDFRFFINGGRPLSTTHTLNQVDNNGLDGQPTIALRNAEAIESLFVATTRSSGEVAMSGASSINIQTRSGSNYFHGSLFDYYLHRGLGALSPLERRNGLTAKPKDKDSLYGATFGGPIQRDRFFFFGSFQGESERANRFFDSTSAYQTPTLAGLEKLGRLFPDSPTVADLLKRSPLQQTVSPAHISRTFQRMIQGVPIEFGEITRLLPAATTGYEANARFDANLTLRDILQAEYWFSKRQTRNSTGRLVAGFTADANNDGHLGLIRWSRNISPISINEATFVFNRSSLSFRASDNPYEAKSSVNIGLFGLAYGNSPRLPAHYNSSVFEFADTFTRAEGPHNIKWGGQVKRRLTTFNELSGERGQYNFFNFDDFVLNQAFTLTVAAGEARTPFTETHQHYFADDSWRVKSNLTLSYGLSYENSTPPLNALAEKIRKREASATTALFAVSQPLSSRTLAKVAGDNNNFAPRFGFAYTPRFQVFGFNPFGFDKTVIRGGVSMAYDATAYRPLADVARSSPNIFLAVINPAAYPGLPRFPDLPDAATLRTLARSDAAQFSKVALTADFRNAYSLNWHLSATRDFDSKALWELNYVGSRGIGLTRLLDGSATNRQSPDAKLFATSRLYASTGRSIYHALQTRLNVQVIDTLTAGLAYTLSKLTDDVPDYAMANISGIQQTPNLNGVQSFAQNPVDLSGGEHALSNLDRRHSLNGFFLYSFPRVRGRSGFWAKLTEGWQASGILEISSGAPYTAVQYFGQSLPSAATFSAMFAEGFGNVRPFTGNLAAPTDTVAFSNAANQYYRFFVNADGTPFVSATGFIIANRSAYHAGDWREARFVYNDYAVEQAARRLGLSPMAFGQTFAAGRAFGNEGRNRLFSPKLANLDFALLKTTKLSEKVSLQFRAEAFNLFNHPNRARPNFILENAGGRGFADDGEVDASPRRLRLALKLIF
ncbi:MAG: carboxypeptidase regulatory-like domain-containing protein [Acidobacteria bacterium]|nr:carboxypeptidase regulatory-like domain-containing protein [Acidobacteriota bacterium]